MVEWRPTLGRSYLMHLIMVTLLNLVSSPALAVDGYVHQARATARGSGWYFSPFDAKFNDDEGKRNWDNVATKEEYKLQPIGFYGVDSILETDHFSLQLNYERGDFSASLSSSSLLNFGFQLRGIPHVDRVRFNTTVLDFYGGKARLLDRGTDAVVDEADFEMKMRRFSFSYQIEEGRIVGEYLDYSIPRNIYIQLKQGEDDNATYTYFPVSDQLLQVGAKVAMLGAEFDNREVDFDNGLLQPFDPDMPVTYGGALLIGGGPYTIQELRTGTELDKGHLVTVGLKGHLLVQHSFGKYISVGSSLDMSLYMFQGIGLPDQMDEFAEQQGVETDDLSVSFGTVDTLSRIYGFIRVGI